MMIKMESKIIKKIGVICQHTKTDTQESFKRIIEPPDQDPCDMDFDDCLSYHIKMPSQNSSEYWQQFTDYEWTDYCPEALRNIREIRGIDPDEYMLTICSLETVRELYLMKKKNQLIGLHDKKYLIRHISRFEIKMLLAAMPLYYSHVEKYNNTLLSKIYGIHAFKPSGGQKVRFAVVGNQMLGQKKIHKQYYFRTNLQGKILSRSGSEEDLAIGFHIEPSIQEELLRQVKSDCGFLESNKLHDYTFMVGMHVCPTPFDIVAQNRAGEQNDSSNSTDSQSYDSDVDSGYNKSPFFGVPARAVDMKRLETCRNPQTYPKLEKKNNVVLYLGIIDTNLEHSMFRIVEHMFRYLQSDNPSGTSRSKAYARNFQEMVASIFPKDGSAFNTDNFH